MASEHQNTFGLGLFFVLLTAQIAVLFAIYALRPDDRRDTPARFSTVQRLNLQSLIGAKGYSCPRLASLAYEERRPGRVVIVATCAAPDRGPTLGRYEIDFRGHVTPR